MELEKGSKNIKSIDIAENLMQTEQWKYADAVLTYLNFQNEVETDRIIEKGLKENKIIGLPRIEDKAIHFLRILDLHDTFERNQYGIREPTYSHKIIDPFDKRINKLLIIIPGLAFDRKKNRLGRGGGYYDRFIHLIKQKRENIYWAVGLCFARQIIEKVPVLSHDEKVDLVITESEIIY